MNRTTGLLLIGFLAGLTADLSVAQDRRGDLLPSQRSLSRYGLKRAWWAQTNLTPSRDSIRHIVVDEENLYVQATSGLVTAFDNQTGRQLWSAQLGRRDQNSFPAVSNSELVLFCTGIRLYAVSKFEGDVIWELTLPGHPSTSPAIDHKQVYVATLDGSVYAFSLKTIHELFNAGLLPKWTRQSRKWRFKTAEAISTPLLTNGRVVNFASRDKSLYAVTTVQRDVIFQFETDAAISAPLAVSGKYLFMTSEDYKLYCVDMNNGSMRWPPFTTGLPIRDAPVVLGQQVLVRPVRGGMYSVSAITGLRQWWNPQLGTFLAATSSFIYTSDTTGNIVLADLKTGQTLGVLPLRNYSVRESNIRTDRLYLGTQSGRVICIHERSQDFPVYHIHPDRRPILPQFAPDAEPPAAKSEPDADDTTQP